MNLALEEAAVAADLGEVPIGAVVVKDKQVISRAGNRTRTHNDVTAHAEMLAIRMACEVLGNERLEECDLYVTLEPCNMCAGAISHARIRRLYFGAIDEKGGAVVSGTRFFNAPTCHHKPEIYDEIAAKEAATILKSFFKNRR